MSQMIGADPDALDRLAADFDRGAGTLEATALRVRVSVHANPWAGARATRFRSDWDQRHGPQLKRTATTLRTAAKHLRQQAAEQRRASSASGAGAGGASGIGFIGRDRVTPTSPLEVWELLKEKNVLQFGLYGIVGAAGSLGSNANLVGRYPQGLAQDLARRHDFFKYKRSLNGIFSVNGLGQKLDNIPGLSKLGAFTGLLDLASEGSKLATNPTPLGVSQTVAAALKTTKNPVAYLGGMALSSINMAADAAKGVDWSPEAFHTTVDFVHSNGGVALVAEEVGKATVEVFTKRIWSIF